MCPSTTLTTPKRARTPTRPVPVASSCCPRRRRVRSGAPAPWGGSHKWMDEWKTPIISVRVVAKTPNASYPANPRAIHEPVLLPICPPQPRRHAPWLPARRGRGRRCTHLPGPKASRGDFVHQEGKGSIQPTCEAVYERMRRVHQPTLTAHLPPTELGARGLQIYALRELHQASFRAARTNLQITHG